MNTITEEQALTNLNISCEDINNHLRHTAIDNNKNITSIKKNGIFISSEMIVTLNIEKPHTIYYNGFPFVWIRMPLTPATKIQIVNGKKYKTTSPENHIFILPPRTPTKIILKNEINSIHIYLKENVLSEVAKELFGNNWQVIQFDTIYDEINSYLSHFLLSIEQFLMTNNVLHKQSTTYLARALATEILTKYVKISTPLSPLTQVERLQTPHLSIVTKFIEDNLHKYISIDKLADLVGLSRTNFVKKFKGSLQDTPHRFLYKMRLRRACQLLTETSRPISNIAIECGFADHAHLSTSFKKEYAMSPSFYRKIH